MYKGENNNVTYGGQDSIHFLWIFLECLQIYQMLTILFIKG